VNERVAQLKNKRRGKNPPRAQARTAANQNWYLIGLLALFGLSRLIYRLLGIKFDASSLNWFWQFVDPQLLKSDFARSIIYLHSQPPAMNLFLGIILYLFPNWETNGFWFCYLGLGIILTVSLYLLLRNLNILPPIAALLTAVFIISPTCILYENWLFYTYPVCVALIFSALCWVKFLRKPRVIYTLLLFFSLGFVVLMWSLFHLVWFLLLAVALLVFRHQEWKRIIPGLLLPFLVVTGWYVKNWLLFNQFTASTWFGMNFSKMTNSMLWYEERKELYNNGTISAISLIPPFSELEKYEPILEPKPVTGILVLDQRKKASGVPNFNNIAYIDIARAYGRDALKILFIKPLAYLRGLAEAIGIFFIPADNYYFLRLNRKKLKTLARIFNAVLLGQFNDRLNTSLRRSNPVTFYLQSFTNTGFILIAAYILAFIYGILLLRRRHPLSQSYFFLWLTLLYAFLVGNFTEVGENNRFRFVLDPLLFPFIGLFIQSLLPFPSKRTRGE